MSQISSFQEPRIHRLAKEMHFQGYSDAQIIDRFLISPATYYRYKIQWRGAVLKVGIHDFLRIPKTAYDHCRDSNDPSFYDIDFARNLALNLNMKLKFVFKRFDLLLPALHDCEFDIALGLLADSSFRRSKADFSDSYIEKTTRDGCLLYNNERLEGLRVAVLRAGANEDFLRRHEGTKWIIRSYDSYGTCYKALLHNWVDAIFAPEPIALALRLKGFPFTTHAVYLPLATQTCIAIGHENQRLTEQINTLLRNMRKSGFIAELSKKHFCPK